jgi:hypothetical protein
MVKSVEDKRGKYATTTNLYRGEVSERRVLTVLCFQNAGTNENLEIFDVTNVMVCFQNVDTNENFEDSDVADGTVRSQKKVHIAS